MTGLLDVEFDTKAFNRELTSLGKELERAAYKALEEALEFGERTGQETTTFRDRSGALRKSIRGQVKRGTSQVEGTLSAGTPYAQFVEAGTRPHAILPRNGTHLRFVVAGNTVFARRVQHPGTKPTFFMTNAAKAAERELLDRLADHVDDALRDFNG